MLERSKQRTIDGSTIYLNGVTEEELQIRDYYESDENFLNEISNCDDYDYNEALDSEDLKMSRIKFTEEGAENGEPDASSYINRKIFRFKYRSAFCTNQQHVEREAKMLER